MRTAYVNQNGTLDVSEMGFKPGQLVEMVMSSTGTLYVRVSEEVPHYLDVKVLYGGQAQRALERGKGTVKGVRRVG